VLLTGGIGSGKSVVGRLLTGWGAYVVDADQLAREVVAPGTGGHAAVVQEFGAGVVGVDGALDRAALADVVFRDRGRLAALEAIVHPLVQQAAEARFALASPGTVEVYEVPVLRERQPGDWVLLVEAPVEVRRARLLARGLSDEQVTARMAQQPDTEGWRALADRVIRNDRDLEALVDETRRAWQEITGEEPPESEREDAVGAAD
jgi:dephospho-CoA kinase